jgi:hypothetical protein
MSSVAQTMYATSPILQIPISTKQLKNAYNKRKNPKYHKSKQQKNIITMALNKF